MTEKKSTAVAVANENSFIALSDPDAVELLCEAAPQPGDLKKLVVPSGTGGAAFVIKGLSGEEFFPQLDVAIAWSSPVERAFFGTDISEGDPGPPNCASPDGITGFGVRDIDVIQSGSDMESTYLKCASCPLSKYGTALNGGRSQACAQKVRLIIFDQVNRLPMILQVPPASLKPLRIYKLDLLNERLRLANVVTRLTLNKIEGNPAYYRLGFSHVRALEETEMTRLAELAQALAAAAAAA